MGFWVRVLGEIVFVGGMEFLMRCFLRRPMLLVLLGVGGFFLLGEAGTPESRVVALRVAPPFVIPVEGSPGLYEGLTVDLWERVARELDLDFTYVEMDLAEMLTAVESGEAAFGVGALTITAERERVLDFSHPFLSSGLGLVVSSRGQTLNWWGALRALFSPDFIKVLGGLGLVLFGTGCLLYLFERKRNKEQFGGSLAEGIGASFWWSAVTMTTVGYGDKYPITFGGKVVGLFWMFAAILIISSFTAAIASALTVSSLGHKIEGPDDLVGHTTAVLANSTSDQYLEQRGFERRAVHSLEDGMLLLRRGEVDAVVHDAPILEFLLRRERDLVLLPNRFQRQDYGLAMTRGEELREAINVALLEAIRSSWWEERIYRYLGR